MNGLQLNSVTGVGSGASGTVASALAPRAKSSSVTAKDASGGAGNNTTANASGATSSSDITANDFLTLLVSELKNQDPTQPTDPNAYIQQLVGVNSLQQLIQINQGLNSIETSSTGSVTSGTAS
jgi:flagellar basal-body rod modification protein FlgD